MKPGQFVIERRELLKQLAARSSNLNEFLLSAMTAQLALANSTRNNELRAADLTEQFKAFWAEK